MAGNSLYDDPIFHQAYSKFRSKPGRLNDIIEQPALRSLMPSLKGRDVIDLGCGTGEMARWALTQGAASVLAFDSSERMIGEAIKRGSDPRLRYEQCRIEDVAIAEKSADVIMSGLAFHYVADFAQLATRIASWLRQDGALVVSVEHPIVTCSERQWAETADGIRLHWPVDRYLEEGSRVMRWLDFETPREHRSISSYLNALVDSGLIIRRVLEPGPDHATLDHWPRLADHNRRPAFLLFRADQRSCI